MRLSVIIFSFVLIAGAAFSAPAGRRVPSSAEIAALKARRAKLEKDRQNLIVALSTSAAQGDGEWPFISDPVQLADFLAKYNARKEAENAALAAKVAAASKK